MFAKKSWFVLAFSRCGYNTKKKSFQLQKHQGTEKNGRLSSRFPWLVDNLYHKPGSDRIEVLCLRGKELLDDHHSCAGSSGCCQCVIIDLGVKLTLLKKFSLIVILEKSDEMRIGFLQQQKRLTVTSCDKSFQSLLSLRQLLWECLLLSPLWYSASRLKTSPRQLCIHGSERSARGPSTARVNN